MTSKIETLSEDEWATISMYAGGPAVCKVLLVSQTIRRAVSNQSNVIWKVLLEAKLRHTFIELVDATSTPSDINHYKTLYGQLDLNGSIEWGTFRLKLNQRMLFDVEINHRLGNTRLISERPVQIEFLSNGHFSTTVHYTNGDQNYAVLEAQWSGQWDDFCGVKWKEDFVTQGSVYIYEGSFKTPTSIHALYHWGEGSAVVRLHSGN